MSNEHLIIVEEAIKNIENYEINSKENKNLVTKNVVDFINSKKDSIIKSIKDESLIGNKNIKINFDVEIGGISESYDYSSNLHFSKKIDFLNGFDYRFIIEKKRIVLYIFIPKEVEDNSRANRILKIILIILLILYGVIVFIFTIN